MGKKLSPLEFLSNDIRKFLNGKRHTDAAIRRAWDRFAALHSLYPPQFAQAAAAQEIEDSNHPEALSPFDLKVREMLNKAKSGGADANQLPEGSSD